MRKTQQVLGGGIEQAMHAVDLGCDRTWRKAKWRASCGIPPDAPCIGILCERPFLSLRPDIDPACRDESLGYSSLAMLEPMVQELRWLIPKLGFGVLSTGHVPSVPFPNLPHLAVAVADDAAETLDWVCGVDVWLLASRHPLAETLGQLADYLRIPCVRFFYACERAGHPRTQGERSFSLEEIATAYEDIAAEIRDLFEVSVARLPMLAFRTPQKIPATRASNTTVDHALGKLDAAINQSSNPTWMTSPISSAAGDALRPAA